MGSEVRGGGNSEETVYGFHLKEASSVTSSVTSYLRRRSGFVSGESGVGGGGEGVLLFVFWEDWKRMGMTFFYVYIYKIISLCVISLCLERESL